MKRVSTGINGLDKLIEGGFPKNSVILVCGGPGTGKTLFGLSFIYNGALKGEAGIYLTFEQREEELRSAARKIGMDFEKLEKEGKIVIKKLGYINDISEVVKEIKEIKEKIKAERLVIDSLSSLELFASTFKSMLHDLPIEIVEKGIMLPSLESIVRRLMYQIIDFLKEQEITTLLISEAQDTEFSKYGVAEFVTDGVIRLETEILGKMLQRSIVILKMRETEIKGGRYGFEISKHGLKVVE